MRVQTPSFQSYSTLDESLKRIVALYHCVHTLPWDASLNQMRTLRGFVGEFFLFFLQYDCGIGVKAGLFFQLEGGAMSLRKWVFVL